MGGLRSKMPLTFWTFLISTMAIAGLPPLAGFFSKDEILAAALHSGHTLVFGVGLLVAGMTAFYMFRIYFVTFWGPALSEPSAHAHESPWTMVAPMAVLGVLSAVAGFVPIPVWVQLADHPHIGHGVDLAVALPSTALALGGIGLAWFLYAGSRQRVADLVVRLGGFYRAVRQKFWFDELYLFVTKRLIFRFVAAPIAWFDRHVVDGGVNLSGWFARTGGLLLGKLQTGQVQTYGSWLVSGVIGAVFVLWTLMKSGGN